MSNTSNTRPQGTPPGIGAGLTDDAKKAMGGAVDAMSSWRNEIASITDRNSAVVYDKMAAAAKSVGWPAEFVDMTTKNMQAASKMQMQAMDHVMETWQQQMKNPGSFSMPSAMSNPFLEQMKNIPGFGGGGAMGMPNFPGMPSFPGMPNFSGMAGIPGMPDMTQMPMPLQFWMQTAEMWQKTWQQAISGWMESQANTTGKGGKT